MNLGVQCTVWLITRLLLSEDWQKKIKMSETGNVISVDLHLPSQRRNITGFICLFVLAISKNVIMF